MTQADRLIAEKIKEDIFRELPKDASTLVEEILEEDERIIIK